MARMFKIDAHRAEYLTVWVEAESFDEAREKFYDGEWDDHDDYDHDNEALDTIECAECGAIEGWCDCDKGGNPDADAPGAVAVADLRPGDWVVPADEFTRDGYFAEDDPVEVTRVSSYVDSDGESPVDFTRLDGSEDCWYVHATQCRFRKVSEPDNVEEQRAEGRRRREEAAERMDREYRQRVALAKLKNPGFR